MSVTECYQLKIVNGSNLNSFSLSLASALHQSANSTKLIASALVLKFSAFFIHILSFKFWKVWDEIEQLFSAFFIWYRSSYPSDLFSISLLYLKLRKVWNEMEQLSSAFFIWYLASYLRDLFSNFSFVFEIEESLKWNRAINFSFLHLVSSWLP